MSDNRLTPLDESFLAVESETAHMHVGWAALFRPPPDHSAPSFEELREHIAGRLSHAPRYRQRLARVPLDVNAPVWIDDFGFDLDRHVLRSPSADWDALVDRAMSAPLDRARPLWEMWIAHGLDGGRIGVVGKAHHCMVDGLAAVELASLLLDPTPEAASPRNDLWQPEPPPGGFKLLAIALMDRASQGLDVARLPFRLAARPRQLLGLIGASASAAKALVHSVEPARSDIPLNDPISSQRHLGRAKRPLKDLKRVKRRFDASINDVVLAAAAGGVRQLLQQRGETPVPLKAMVPVSLRDGDGAGALGNQISFVFVDLPCDEPDPVRRLREVKMAMSKRKQAGEPEGASTVLKAFGYAPRTVQQVVSHMVASPRAFNLVVSNIPGPRQPLYMLGCELEEVYPVVPIADRHAVAIGVTTIKDDSFFGVYADPETLPEADLLATAINESIEELLASS
jgi:diacylglycerol O-acyltransferase / wax synthase